MIIGLLMYLHIYIIYIHKPLLPYIPQKKQKSFFWYQDAPGFGGITEGCCCFRIQRSPPSSVSQDHCLLTPRRSMPTQNKILSRKYIITAFVAKEGQKNTAVSNTTTSIAMPKYSQMVKLMGLKKCFNHGCEAFGIATAAWGLAQWIEPTKICNQWCLSGLCEIAKRFEPHHFSRYWYMFS